MESTLKVLKALSDGNRFRIVVALMTYEELCVCQITEMLHIAMATVSRHMSILQDAHLVQSRKDGRWVYYRIACAFPDILRKWISVAIKGSPEVSKDLSNLKGILACEPGSLCKPQAKRGVV